MISTHNRVPKEELAHRLSALRSSLSEHDPKWEMVILSNRINLYYFTGTMQDGILIITPDAATFWVRRYLPRAQEQSFFEDLRPPEVLLRTGRAAIPFHSTHILNIKQLLLLG